jgi:hypothetical protein
MICRPSEKAIMLTAPSPLNRRRCNGPRSKSIQPTDYSKRFKAPPRRLHASGLGHAPTRRRGDRAAGESPTPKRRRNLARAVRGRASPEARTRRRGRRARRGRLDLDPRLAGGSDENRLRLPLHSCSQVRFARNSKCFCCKFVHVVHRKKGTNACKIATSS